MTTRKTSSDRERADVLVVEDEAKLRSLVLRVLPEMGLGGVGASSVDEGWRSLRKHNPRVLLLDIRLGLESGLDLLESLRADGDDRPVVLMTAFADVPGAQRALRCGAADFITKPFTLAELERALERAWRGAMERSTGLASPDGGAAPAGDHPVSIDEVKRRALRGALERAGGNKRLAAKTLGISRRTLYHWLERFGEDA